MKKAVLFLVFNRSDTTKRVFEEIKNAKPPRLYIASDGPRTNKEGESETVAKIRKMLVDGIDWNCEVKTLFRDENLGCGKAVSGAIAWFFNQEESGVILEDDCLPNQSFFNFCENLLDYYKDNKKVMHISGDQFVSNFENGASYYFAKIQHVWGWASWADRWKYYDFDLKNYDKKNVEKFSSNANVQNYWRMILDKMKKHEIDTWDYQWTFKVIEKDGLCINPSKNLISNIGFGAGGTHTTEVENPLANMNTYIIEKIIHPNSLKLDISAVDDIYQNHFGITYNNVIKTVNIFEKMHVLLKHKIKYLIK